MKRPVRMTWTPTAHDASRYALDGPQALEADQLDSLPSSELEAIEAELIQGAGLVLEDVWLPRDRTVKVSRAVMWLSLRLKGVGLAWADFDPQVRKTVFDLVLEDDDSLPPDEAPAGDSSPDMAE